MTRIAQHIRDRLAALLAVPPMPDPLEAMSNRSLADLPPDHPFGSRRAGSR